MTKADIVENVYEKVGGFSKKEAAEIVETVFDTIKETLERGEKIKISGFGNFVVRDKNARAGRNPQTGQEITISARRVLDLQAEPGAQERPQRLSAAADRRTRGVGARYRRTPPGIPDKPYFKIGEAARLVRREALRAALLGDRVQVAPPAEDALAAAPLPHAATSSCC